MNSNDLRKIAQNISDERAQAAADAAGLLDRYMKMRAAGTYGLADLQAALNESADADERAHALAEQEAHAWDAVSYAQQNEFDQYLNTL